MRARALPLGRDQSGATVMEFGLLFVPFCILLMGGMDVGYQVYVRTVVAGALEAATRSTTIESADSTTIEAVLEDAVLKVMPHAIVHIEKGSFYSYAQINTLERLTKDSNGNNQLDNGDCWEDIDDDGTRNVVTTGKSGIGGADDVVRYNVSASYTRLLPIYNFIGVNDVATVSAVTLVKRQPYAGQSNPPERCKL